MYRPQYRYGRDIDGAPGENAGKGAAKVERTQPVRMFTLMHGHPKSSRMHRNLTSASNQPRGSKLSLRQV
jgi:hypothetical protein